jgi:hypothetical protein
MKTHIIRPKFSLLVSSLIFLAKKMLMCALDAAIDVHGDLVLRQRQFFFVYVMKSIALLHPRQPVTKLPQNCLYPISLQYI